MSSDEHVGKRQQARQFVVLQNLAGQVLEEDAFLTQEALNEIARVTTANLVRLETGEAFLAGTAL